MTAKILRTMTPRFIPCLASALLLSIPGCKRTNTSDPAGPAAPQTPPKSSVRIVCSCLPVYLLALNVVGGAEGVLLETLLPPQAGCPHDYEMSIAETHRVAQADWLLFLGDVDEHLRRSVVKMNASAGVLVIDQPPADSTAGHDHHDHDQHDHATDHADSDARHDHDHRAAAHRWLDPRQAADILRRIQQLLSMADPPRAAAYQKGADACAARLLTLAAEADALRASVEGRRVAVVGDLFHPLLDALGLKLVAELDWPEGGEPTPRKLADMMETVQREQLTAVFCDSVPLTALRGVFQRRPEVTVHELDPILRGRDAPSSPDDYEQRMRANLEAVRAALAP